ncbi:MAG: hypothetical protein ACFFAK_01945 [Promethearchaeota archaeon]
MKISTILEDALDDVLLKKEEFYKLKLIINQAVSGKISEKQLREYILKSRIKMKEDLLKFFPSYVRLENDTHHNLTSDRLLKELKERNEFLEQIGGRINTIYHGLKEKIDQE